eukprot:965482_1
MPSLALCLMTTSSLFVAHVISIAIHLTESPGNQIIPPEKVVVKEVVPRLSMFAQEETSFDVQESEIGVEQPESEIVRVTSLTSGIYIADGGVAYCIAHYIEKDAHYIEKEAMNTINIIGKNLSTQPPFENGQVIIDGAERLRVHDSRSNYGALKELSELEQLYEVPNGRAIINGALRDLFAYYYVKEEATAHTSNNDLKLGFILLIRAKHTDSLAALDRISLHMTHSLRSIASASTDSLDGNYIIIMRVFARKQRRICTAIQSR